MSRQLRDRLAGALRTDEDLDAFCLDCFRDVFDRFSAGMDRTAKINRLLALAEPEEITRCLDEWSQPLRKPPAQPGAVRPPGQSGTAPTQSTAGAPAPAAASSPSRHEAAAPIDLSIEHIKNACARLMSGQTQGTGYLVRPDCLITCAHVVRDAGLGGTVAVRFHGSDSDTAAAVAQIDETTDWALLRLRTAVTDRHALPLAVQAEPDARWLAFGFPAATGMHGIILGGVVRDPSGKDAGGAVGVQLFSEEAAAARGALLGGASGAPVLSKGQVIGHLRNVLPDEESRAQLGLVFACSPRSFAQALPASTSPSTFRTRSPQSEYDPLWYIPRRDAELMALNKLRDRGVPVTLQAPEGFGKSWLLGHLLERLRQQDLGSGKRTEVVRFNLRCQAESAPASLDSLLTELLRAMLEQLGVERVDSLIARAAKLPGDSKRRFRRSFEQHGLSRPLHRFLLVIEEGDALHGSSAETDFFALLRAMAEDTSEPYQRLRLLVTVGAEAGFLETTNHSAFFGLSPPIVIDGFSVAQLRAAAALYGLSPEDPGIEMLHRLTGGHPHYARLAIYEAVCSERSLVQLLAKLDSRGGPFATSLQRLRRYIHQEDLQPLLCALLKNPRTKVSDAQYLKLYRKGLVVESDPGEYRIGCPLFENYFRALCS